MADNKLELVVTVEVDRANQSLKTVNVSLSNIERAATKAARGASQGVDGMTASMVKGATAGNLLADAIQSALRWAKEWTIGAAKDAAHVARMESATRALAKAHGINAQSMQTAVAAVQEVGFENEAALRTINRLIVADLDLSKAQGLAKLAKDAAALEENLAPHEALEKIVQAIEFGNARALRTVGLRLDFENEIHYAELKLGRTLSENEKVQIRYNAVMREAAKIQGAGAAASTEAESQMKALGREVKDLREAVGARFQDEFKVIIGYLRDLVRWLRDNTGALETFAKGALAAAGVVAASGLAVKIAAVARSFSALNLAVGSFGIGPVAGLAARLGTVAYAVRTGLTGALVGSEVALLNLGRAIPPVAAGLGVWWAGNKLLEHAQGNKELDTTAEAIKKINERLKETPEWWIQRGLVPPKTAKDRLIEYIKSLDEKKAATPAKKEPTIEELERAAAIRKRQREIERETLETALGAETQELTGIFRLIGEFRREIAKYATFVDDKGIEHRIQLTAKTRENVERELHSKVRAMQREEMAEYVKEQEEINQQRMEIEARRFEQRLDNDEQIARRDLEHIEQVYAFEEQRAGFERDARLRQREGVDAQTLQQKIAVEQRKAEIEIEYLEKVHEVKQRLYDMDTSRLLIEEELTLKRLGYRAGEIKARIAELSQQREDIRQQNQEATDAAIQAARENAANRTAQLVREHNRTIFESLKQQAGGVFDALLQKSQSVWSAIANSFKIALLTAIKEVVTSRVAATLMSLFTGQKVTFAGGGAGPGGGGGTLGGLGGMLGVGAAPVFGGSGGPIPGGSAGGWGTPPFVPSGGVTSKAGGGLLGGATGWKNLLSSLGNIGYRPERWRLDEMGNMTKLAGARGIGGWQGGALLAGGSLLALEGLRRGGWSGVAMTTAGGAMIGAKFGGPLGAAIGAGVGFVAGLVRLFVKSAEEKAREKIKALYGVDISDKGLLKQIVDTAKQAFGGNLDVAIRSQQIRDLIQLYAMSTGQPTRGMPATVHPLDIVQQGGSLYQSPGYSNGAALPGLGGLPTLDTIGGGTPSAAGPVVIQLDGPATTALLRGEAVRAMADNPRTVQSATLAANRSNAGRRELTALQLSPGTLTA